MSYDSYHKRKIGKRTLKPETQMMGYGYDPSLSEGSLKPPIFLTSTFVFKSAQDGKDFFDFTSGRRVPPAGQSPGLVYSRFNNPNLEVLEDRLALWEGGERALVFSSGMAAISTTLWAYVRPGDVLLMSQPLYGGTETLIEKVLTQFGVSRRIHGRLQQGRGAAVRRPRSRTRGAARQPRLPDMTETPANPTNSLVDLRLMREMSEHIGATQAGGRPPVLVDNTFLGPVFQRRSRMARTSCMYSLTKYVGGHSDLVAGGVVGAHEARRRRSSSLRGALGTQLDPNTSWMIMRSMETMSLRMQRCGGERRPVAQFLQHHPKIAGGQLPRLSRGRRSASRGVQAPMRQRRFDVRLQGPSAARPRRSGCSTGCRSSSSPSASAAPSR